MKSMMSYFPYPLFVSLLHFTWSYIFTLVCMKATGEGLPESSNIFSGKFRGWYSRCVLPAGMVGYVSIAANNAGLVFIGAGLNAMISLATPVITALFSAFFG